MRHIHHLAFLLHAACAPPPPGDTGFATGALTEAARADPVATPTSFQLLSGRAWPTWRWMGDDPVDVMLVGDTDPTLTGGVYISANGVDLSLPSARPWADTPGRLPALLTGARPTTRAEASTRPDLRLNLRGSDEHGCDDAVTMTVRVLPDADGVTIHVEILGAPYLALPRDGDWTVRHDGAQSAVDTTDWLPGDDAVYTNFASLRIQDSSMGDIAVLALDTPDWLQLQAHEDFIELDVDHSCETTTGPAAHLAVVTRTSR